MTVFLLFLVMQIRLLSYHHFGADDAVAADSEADSSILLGIHPKTLTGPSLHWHISEKELFVMVYGGGKCGEFISEVVACWSLSADQSDWRFNKKGHLMCPVPKFCFASDSKAALGMLNVLRLPSGRLDLISIRAMPDDQHALAVKI